MRRLATYPKTSALLAFAIGASAAAMAALALQPALGDRMAALLQAHTQHFLTAERHAIFSVQSGVGLLAIALVLLLEVIFQGYRGSALSRLGDRAARPCRTSSASRWGRSACPGCW